MTLYSIDSSTIWDRQFAALVAKHPQINRRLVKSAMVNGQVVVAGSVDTYFEKQLVQEAIRSIAGETAIDNQLKVQWRLDSES